MNPVLQTENLSHYYGSVPALNQINLSIFAGEFVALIGQNGCGKTTLAKHFNGLLKPGSGIVRVKGRATTQARVSSLAQTVGYVFQNPDHQIFNENVEKEVSFGLRNLKIKADEIERRVDQALQQVSLQSSRQASPYDLSRGQRQRVALASVLAMQPEIIILDEPTTGQDYKESMQILQILKDLNAAGHTILFITHSMSLVAEYADRVILLDQGNILKDEPVAAFFEGIQEMQDSSITLPPITQLGYALGVLGGPLLNVEDAFHKIQSLMGGNEHGINY